MPFAHNHAVAIHYDTFGDSAASAVVLIPGTGRQATDFDMIRERLVEAGYYVVQMDNRDVGPSTAFVGMPANLPALHAAAHGGPVATPAYTSVDMAQDVLAVMDDIGLTRAHLVGRSVGGMVAQTVAISAPARVASLVLIMTAGRSVAEPVTRARMEALEAETIADAGAYAARQIVAAQAGSAPGDFDAARIEAEALAAFARGVHPGGTARHYAVALALPDLRPAAMRLSCPALIIHGTLDRVIPPLFGQEIAAALPAARYIELADMAHDGAPRVQAIWAELILDHLSALP